jgi:hypothetical protein
VEIGLGEIIPAGLRSAYVSIDPEKKSLKAPSCGYKEQLT